MKSLAQLLALSLLYCGNVRSDEIVLENGGLKNLYRLVLADYSSEQDSVHGRLEILPNEAGAEVETRIAFAGRVTISESGPDSISLTPTSMISFFPPPDLSNPTPSIHGWFYGRGTEEPGVLLEFWNFDVEKGEWDSNMMSFGTVPEAAAESDLLTFESLGGMRLGITEAAVRERVEGRIFVGEETFEGATGLTVQDWLVPEQGVEFQMAKPGDDEPFTVKAIKISRDSSWKTLRGIGIGDSRAEVIDRYSEHINEEEASHAGGNDLVIGSIYGGIVVTFDDSENVSQIFLGAAAE